MAARVNQIRIGSTCLKVVVQQSPQLEYHIVLPLKALEYSFEYRHHPLHKTTVASGCASFTPNAAGKPAHGTRTT